MRSPAPWGTLLVALLAACGATTAAPPSVAPATAPPALPDRDDWFGVYLGEAKIGWSHVTVGPDAARPGIWRIADLTFMRVAQLGAPLEMSFRYEAFVTRDLEPVGFTLETDALFQRIRAVGTVQGDVLRLEVQTGGETRTREIEIAGVDLFGLKEYEAVRGGLAVGKVLEGTIFEPTTMAVMPYRLEVAETESMRLGSDDTDVFVLRTRMREIESRTWMLADGTVLRTEVPMGGLFVAMRREDERTARTLSKPGVVADLALRLAVPAAWPAGAPDARAARRTVVRIDGIETPLEGMDGGVQRVEKRNGGILLTVDLDAVPAEPAEGSALEPSLFVQADAPRIVEAARAALDGVPADPSSRAAALARWVFGRIEKAAAFTFPSALDVLDNPVGDCNEHAVLYAALARASGIPTRIASGLVWLDGRYYYHAWNEVHVGGRWRPVDPTFGQAEADAARIRLVIGELDEQSRIASVAGRLAVRIVEAR